MQKERKISYVCRYLGILSDPEVPTYYGLGLIYLSLSYIGTSTMFCTVEFCIIIQQRY